MNDLIPRLIPAIVLGAASPIPMAILATLLMTDRGLKKAVAFTLGIFSYFAVIGSVVLLAQGTDVPEHSSGPRAFDYVTIAMGVVLLVLALKKLVTKPEPITGPPKYMARAEGLSVRAAAVFGLFIALINFKQIAIYLAGLSQISESSVGTVEGWIALAVLTVGIQAGLVAGIAYAAFAPDHSARVFAALREWLIQNSRVVSIAVGLVVGVALIALGIEQL
jgi:threonine/homoserine/homoserine lactone efflux protein